MKKLLNYKKICLILAASILLLLPTYLIRFKISVLEGGIPSTFLEIFIYFIFILFLIERLKSKGKIFSIKFILPLVLFILAAISSYYARERTVALGELKAYFFDGLLVFLMFYAYAREETFQKWSLNFYLLSGLTVSIWGLLQRAKLVGLISHQMHDPLIAAQLSQGRIFGPFESPNYLAMYIAPLIVALVILYFRNTQFNYLKKFIWPLAIIFGLALILTQSFSSIIAVFIALAAYFAIFGKRNWWYFVFAIIIVAFGLFFINKYNAKSGSLSARNEIYHAAWRIGAAHPLIGIGPGNFPQYFLELPIKNRINYEALHPHDIFLAFWVYLGWPGLIVFLILIGLCLRKRNLTKNPVIYFMFLTILLNGLTDTTFFKNDLAIIFWYLVAFLI